MERRRRQHHNGANSRLVGTAAVVALAALLGWLAAFFLYGTCQETPSGTPSGMFNCLEYRLGPFNDPYLLGATSGLAALLGSTARLYWGDTGTSGSEQR